MSNCLSSPRSRLPPSKLLEYTGCSTDMWSEDRKPRFEDNSALGLGRWCWDLRQILWPNQASFLECLKVPGNCPAQELPELCQICSQNAFQLYLAAVRGDLRVPTADAEGYISSCPPQVPLGRPSWGGVLRGAASPHPGKHRHPPGLLWFAQQDEPIHCYLALCGVTLHVEYDEAFQ